MELLAGFSALQVGGALATALIAAFIRGLAGFGMAILLVPVLALALTPVEAVMVTNGVALLVGLSEARSIWSNAEKSALRISGWVLVATLPGLWLLSITAPDLARVLIALVALSAFAAILLPQRPADLPGHVHTGVTGIATGLLTGFAGMPGPPVVPYYVGRAIPRVQAKASMLLIFSFAALVGLGSGAALGVLQLRHLLLSLLLFPAVLVGNWLGALAFGKVNDRIWRSFVALMLAAAAAVAFVKLLQA
ncbi:sulfite exporter TauE/SafE family protein [Qipengyuania marisflavi]|uniref:Probable membrane transporter protein n=1 Tax=Qipengyuania marisflavi TaxID=2486356 RepID=A0A5S3P5K4_9SPHN|nr:sulfite exporter TauE/SafE family protein [Qipengyuania marisflavi]TMM48320.1 sulfite exporter TauE/SafE family protein [Qipengyuania marisflavi]